MDDLPYAKSMGIKVLIGGVGGDDIFSGYRRHQALLLNNKLDCLPKNIKKTVHSYKVSSGYL